MQSSIKKSRWVLMTLMLVLAASQAFAGGPLLIYNAASQTPYAYGPAVPMYTDLGGLGLLTNAAGDAMVTNSAAQWSGVPSSSFNASVVGDFSALGLPDITSANAGTVIGAYNGGTGIHVIYDNDGLIIQNFFGAPPGVLGIASPDFATGAVLTESWVVLNGTSVNPADLPAASSWAGVVTHEMGHSINLAHTQTNGAIIFFGDDAGPGPCGTPYGGGLGLSHTETMYPYIDPSPGSTGVFQTTVTHPDDISSLSNLYPAAGFPASHATIEGVVYATNGTTPLSGVNVIARNVSNPWADANSALTGDYTQGGVGNDGRFKLTGLTPGADYVLYVDTIVNGGYSTSPLQPLGAAEEYWNQFESNSTAADPPCDYTLINMAPGQTFTADMKLNSNAVAAPTISATPASFSFSIPTNTTDFAPLIIQNVAAAGAADLVWFLTESGGDSPWLSIAPTSGSTATGGFDLPNVTVDATGLAPGPYTWDIEIASNDTATPLITKTVNLQVLPTVVPEIHVDVMPVFLNPGDKVTLHSLPSGGGDPLQTAQLFGGGTVDATIGIHLFDEGGAPIPNFPANLITVTAQLGGWTQCASDPLIANGPTDAGGYTTISGALFAGGFSGPGELMEVIVIDPDVVATNYPGGLAGLEYFVNSADSDSDLVVNLTDISAFAVAYSGPYDYAFDFAWDGVLNLSDVAKLGVGNGAICPPGKAAQDEVAVLKPTGTIGVSFDAMGNTIARSLEIGERTEAFVVVQGPAAERGVAAFDARVRVSSNVTVHSQGIVGEGFNLSNDGDFVAGITTVRHAKAARPVQLVKLTVSVTDEQPAYFWVEPSRSSVHDLPTVAFDGQIHATRPVSGDISAPVASLNDAEFALAGGNTPNPELSMGIAPNPFNPMTKISFSLPASGKVDLRIYDARGQLVTTLRNETMEAGAHQVTWNGTDQSGRNMSSGVYFSKLQTSSGTLLQKMMLMK